MCTALQSTVVARLLPGRKEGHRGNVGVRGREWLCHHSTRLGRCSMNISEKSAEKVRAEDVRYRV